MKNFAITLLLAFLVYNVGKSQMYPNPTSGQLTVEHNFGTVATLDVMTLTGEIVSTHQLNSNRSYVDISNLANGVYIVAILTDKQKSVTKLIKSN
jgi:hypothetical protein